jgi:amino acid permease
LNQVEFVISVIKIIACIGFMFLGVIINCGGVPTDHRGYIGARYWYFILEVATGEADGLKQAFTLRSVPQWLPWLLRRLRHRGVCLHWY